MRIVHTAGFCRETLCFMPLEKSPILLSGLYVEFLKTYPPLSSQCYTWGGGFVSMLLQRMGPGDECHKPRVQVAFLTCLSWLFIPTHASAFLPDVQSPVCFRKSENAWINRIALAASAEAACVQYSQH